MNPPPGPVKTSVSKKFDRTGFAERLAFGVESYNSAKRASRAAEEQWNAGQRVCARVIRHPAVESLVGLLVVTSFVLMVIETDSAPDVPWWVDHVNLALLATYTLEMCLRLFVYRRAFFFSCFSVFELVIILLDLLALLSSTTFSRADNLPSLAPLRICRTLRLVRGFKLAVRFPQLTLIVKGLTRGLSASFWGAGLLLMLLTVWAVLAVHFVQPVNERVALSGVYGDCRRCPGAFASVRSSMLTFIQQIIAGDSWGQVTIPVMEEAPETAIFFGLVFISIHVTLMNVVLAVIVDVALRASEEEKEEEKVDNARHDLVELCRQIDADDSGDLTEDEINSCFDLNEDFRDLLLSMDIKKDNLHVIFGVMDYEGTGVVNYEEFIHELLAMKRNDNTGNFLFLKHYMTDIRKSVQTQVRSIRNELRQTLRDLALDSGVMIAQNTESTINFRSEKYWSEENHMDSTGSEKEPDEAKDKDTDKVHAVARVGSKRLAVSHSRSGGSPLGTGHFDVDLRDAAREQPCSLRELGRELRDLRKVISDELMQSIRQLSQPTVPLVPLVAGDPLRSGQAFSPNFLVAAAANQAAGGGMLAAAPTVVSQELPPTVRDEHPRSPSSWAFQKCCATHREAAAVVLEELRKPAPKA